MATLVTEPTIMLAAGGTGGHLFPAFALAEELGRRGFTVDLITDMRGDRYGTGFPARAVHQIPSATLKSRAPLAVAATAVALGRGLVGAYRLLGQVRPVVVAGFGGYPTFPPLVAARARGIATLIHEQNAVLGRANRMLAARATAIATSFEQTKLLEGAAGTKARFTGNPVRSSVIEASRHPYAPPTATSPIVLLVFGGSQGARYFSDTVPPALAALPAAVRARLAVIQQCRDEDLPRVEEAYRTAGINANLAAFFRNLPELMATAHFVIGRAGASTVAELTVLGRPSLLVPLPHALDNDQLNNAKRLAESGAAWCIEQQELSVERLSGQLGGLFARPDALAAAAASARRLGRPDAVARLADVIVGLANTARR